MATTQKSTVSTYCEYNLVYSRHRGNMAQHTTRYQASSNLHPDSYATSPYNSIVHLRQQPRNDLHLFLSVLVLLAFDLGSLCATLLLCLASLHPLFHGQVLTKLSQVVVFQAEAVEERAVGDGV